MGYEYLNSGQARAYKRDLIRFSLNWFGTCKRGFSVVPVHYTIFNQCESIGDIEVSAINLLSSKFNIEVIIRLHVMNIIKHPMFYVAMPKV